VFNAGVVADLSEEVNVFAKFSQGFSAPTFSLVGFPNFLGFDPEGFSIQEDIENLRPQKIDEYEIGIRGNWESVNASLSAFYNFSAFGETFEALPEVAASEQIRSPKRVYGVEATADWEPANNWQLGGILSWNEGDLDPNNDGDFRPISTFDIQPLKLTAYLENQTTSGWRNRLQVLFVVVAIARLKKTSIPPQLKAMQLLITLAVSNWVVEASKLESRTCLTISFFLSIANLPVVIVQAGLQHQEED